MCGEDQLYDALSLYREPEGKEVFARKRPTATRLEIANTPTRRARADSCIIHQCRMLQDAAWLRQCASRVCGIDTECGSQRQFKRVILYACHILLSADPCEGAHSTECRIRANKPFERTLRSHQIEKNATVPQCAGHRFLL